MYILKEYITNTGEVFELVRLFDGKKQINKDGNPAYKNVGDKGAFYMQRLQFLYH